MHEDLDDTVIVPPRQIGAPPEIDTDTDETIIGRTGAEFGSGATNESDAEDSAETLAFYAFRIGLGSRPIVLDAPYYVGRRPSAPRIPSRQPPRLVRVPSVLKEVSATHLEVRQVGASVIVTDLKSTNGSIVMMPGSAPRKLRQGESMVVTPGTLVDIGDDNILQILPMQRPV